MYVVLSNMIFIDDSITIIHLQACANGLVHTATDLKRKVDFENKILKIN